MMLYKDLSDNSLIASEAEVVSDFIKVINILKSLKYNERLLFIFLSIKNIIKSFEILKIENLWNSLY